MEEIPLSALFGALVLLLLASAFFSISETSMMAANRYRLRHRAALGHRGARLALDLLARTDKMLGVILLGNNLINAAAATLVSVITITLFGEEKWALGIGTLVVTFAILVFSEITPKIIGASHANTLAEALSFVLWPLLRAAYPVVWFVNLFASGLLTVLRLKPTGDKTAALTPEELRSVVLESGHFIPQQHRSILVNLFDLEHVTVSDIMTPRGEIEAIDLQAPIEEIAEKLATSFHTRQPVFEGEPGNVVGVLQVRRLVTGMVGGPLSTAGLRTLLSEPYFVPAATPIFAQLQFFRDNRQRMGLVVDEYGELLGLITLEDIIEEIVGKFTTSIPRGTGSLSWDSDGSVVVDGRASLRDLNRALALKLPVEGPKTLNGLIVEHLRDIPEIGVGLCVNGVRMEIVQTQDRKVKTVRLMRPVAEP